MDNLYQLHTGRGGYQVLLFLADIVSLEQRLDDGCTGRWTTDTVFLQRITQFVVIHQLARRFHSTQQGGFRIRPGRLRPLLIQIGDVRSAFSFHKSRKHILLFSLLLFLLLRLCRGGAEDNTPTRFQNLLTGGLELYALYLAQYGGSGKLTIGIEYSNETACYQIEYATLHIRQILRMLAGRNNGVVVCYLRVIENLFGLQQCSSCQRGCKCLVITQTFQDAGAFGIDVITQIGSVYTWIGSHFLLIQRLDDFQRLISGIGKLLVTFHLQRSQVKQAEWRLPPLFLGDIRHGKRRILNLVQ